MKVPGIPEAVQWRNGMVLEPSHFEQTDRRASALSHLAAAAADPWPWGFVQVAVDPTALASSQLRVDCEGFFPGGAPFRQAAMTRPLPEGQEGQRLDYQILAAPDGGVGLSAGADAPAGECLPVARLTFQSGCLDRGVGLVAAGLPRRRRPSPAAGHGAATRRPRGARHRLPCNPAAAGRRGSSGIRAP